MQQALRAIAAATVACAVAAAQQLPAQAPPAFRAGTDIVEVDVVVQDRNGTFVSDLALDDFDVRDNGQPQQLQQFYLHLVDDVRKPLPRAGGAPAGDAVASATLAAGASRIFVIVFDDVHLTPAGFKRTQAAAMSLFSEQFLDGDVGGVVLNGRMVNNRLTSDRAELLKAVKDAKPSSKSNARLFEEREWPRLSEIEAVRIVVNNDRPVLEEAIRRACADDTDQCRVADTMVQAKAIRQAAVGRAESAQTVQILRTLLDGLARIDGRKSVLLMSEGFVAEEAWPHVQDAVGLAARANARIYTLDARGLERGMSDRLGGTDPGGEDAGSRLLQQLDFGGDSINSLATDTGGFVVRNTNIFDKAIAQIAADAGNYYVLGYRQAAFDATFHKLSVKVKRPGLVLRARRGYLASPRPLVTGLPPTAPAPAAAQDDLPPSPAAPAPSSSPDGPTTAPRSAESDPAPAAAGIVTASAPTAIARLRPDSLKHVESLVSSAPASAAATTGWEAYQRGDLESARSSLAVAAEDGSSRPWVHYALGQAKYGLGDFPGAVAAWERVRATTPEFQPVYFDLVDGYLQQKDYDKAIRVMRGAKGRWPGDPQVLAALGVAQIWRGALADAVGSFQQAIALAPEDGVGYFNLGKALELRYRASRRYVQQLRAWIGNDEDRTNAIANYQRYLTIGGPFENAAREGLSRLEWDKKP